MEGREGGRERRREGGGTVAANMNRINAVDIHTGIFKYRSGSQPVQIRVIISQGVEIW